MAFDPQSELLLLEKVAIGGELPALLAEILAVYEAALPGMRGSVMILDEEGRHLASASAPNLPADFLRAIDGIEIGPEVGSCGTAAFKRETIVVENIETSPLWRNFLSLSSRFGLKACWSVPLFGPGRQLVGTFAFYANEPRNATPAELGLLERGAHLAGIAIHRVRTEKALQESRETFRLILERAGVGVAQIDSHTGQFLVVNKRYCEITGCTEAEMKASTFQDITHPEDLAQDLAYMERLRRGEIREYSMEKRYIRRDGSLVWVQLTVSAAWTPGNPPDFHIAVVEDITERKKFENELLRTQRLESLGTLAAGIAHDFNNLLTGLFGWMEMIRFTSPGPVITDYLDRALASMERARHLTHQLLTFAAGGAPAMTSFNMEELFHEIAVFVLSGSNITWRVTGSGTPSVQADENQIKQVVENLLINAREAMPGGGTITVHIETTDGHVRTSIADNGPGIDSADLAHIFDPFFSRKPGGRGLGLAMVHSIVTRHKGHISVESTPGRGTTFVFELPRGTPGAALPRIDLKIPPDLKVLIVDDEPDVRRTLELQFIRAGCIVTTAPEGTIALAWADEAHAQGAPYDLAVLDLTIPGGMGGVEAVSGLRKIEPDIAAIVSSGYAEDAALADPAGSGFDAGLLKPWNGAMLARAVHEALRARGKIKEP